MRSCLLILILIEFIFFLNNIKQKAAYFHMNPSKGTIPPDSTLNVICSYIPTGLGSFSLDSSFYLLGKAYSIPLKLYGTSSNVADKIKYRLL